MPLLEVCAAENTPKNTGVVCEASMLAPAMIIAVDPSLTWTAEDLADFYEYCITQIHAKKMFPLIGSIKGLAASDENDVTQTFDNGAQVFVRSGVYNWLLSTNTGGNCLAAALASFNGRRFSFIEIDIDGKVCFRANADGTFSGLRPNEMYSPKPTKATFTTVNMNNLFISVTPKEYIENSKILKQDGEDLTGLKGLIDAVLIQGTVPNTQTSIALGLVAECSKKDLIAGRTGLGAIANYIIKKADGTTVTPTAPATVGVNIVFTIPSQTAGSVLTVQGVSPSALLANNVEGIEIVNILSVTIPE